MDTTRRLDAYVRVSSTGDRGGESFQSPEQQRDAITRWAATHRVDLAAWHEDIDESGGRMERPGLDRLIERIHAHRTGGVVVAWLDRFSRASVRDALTVVEDVRAHDGRVVALDVAGLDIDDPFGEYALTMMLAMSRMQLRRIGERWAMARRNAIARGVHTGRIPYGYRADQGRHLTPISEEARVVREVFERKANGHTALEIARWLDEAAPRGGGGIWPRQAVRYVIQNRTYLGAVSNGPYTNEHAHEPLVSPALWHRAQNRPGTYPGRNPRMLLARVARCACCGHLLRGAVHSTSSNRIYKCGGRFSTGCCPSPVSVSGAPMEVEVANQLFAYLDRKHERSERAEVELRVARAAVENARRELGLFLQLTPKTSAGVELHGVGIAEREEHLRAAESGLLGLLDAAECSNPDGGELRQRWPQMSLGQRRETFRQLIDAVLVRPAKSRSRWLPIADRIRVLFRGEAPPELRGIARATRSWTWTQGEKVELGQGCPYRRPGD